MVRCGHAGCAKEKCGHAGCAKERCGLQLGLLLFDDHVDIL